MIFSTELELACAIKTRFPEPGVIGIDGWTGVGKTTLAKRFAGILGGSAYDLDCALTKNKKSYVEFIQLDVINDVLAKSNGILFLSGICIREILKRLDHSAIAHVYVKRMATWVGLTKTKLQERVYPNFRKQVVQPFVARCAPIIRNGPPISKQISFFIEPFRL
jgi:adenylate kinase family enzyme